MCCWCQPGHSALSMARQKTRALSRTEKTRKDCPVRRPFGRYDARRPGQQLHRGAKAARCTILTNPNEFKHLAWRTSRTPKLPKIVACKRHRLHTHENQHEHARTHTHAHRHTHSHTQSSRFLSAPRSGRVVHKNTGVPRQSSPPPHLN